MSDKIISCGLSLDDIEKLADRVENGSLSKIKIKNGSGEIVIEKEVKTEVMPVAAPLAPVMTSPAPAANAAASELAAPQTPSYNGNVVKAPIVGTFYSSPSPDSAPFVTVGSSVSKGDTIFIIESMKLMNEVQSDFNGIVKEILVENGSAVEYDQPIMVIE